MRKSALPFEGMSAIDDQSWGGGKSTDWSGIAFKTLKPEFPTPVKIL